MSATLAISETLTPKVQERSGLYKVGGVSFVVVGILFLSKYLLDLSLRQGGE